MTKARDIMTADPAWIRVDTTVVEAARKMRELDVGSLPICDGDKHLLGMITDRDIVTKVLAEGRDPAQATAGDLSQGEAVTIGADDSVEEALRTMKEHAVRRLPVIDGQEMIGIVSQGDVATNLPEDKVGDLVEAISAAP
jgi:CBS domain-containing protein